MSSYLPSIDRVAQPAEQPGAPERVVYHVNCVAAYLRDHRRWALVVEPRGGSRWAVTHNGRYLSLDGEWHDHTAGPDRELPLHDALELAQRHAPLVTIDGVTVHRRYLQDQIERGRGQTTLDETTIDLVTELGWNIMRDDFAPYIERRSD